MDDDGLGEESRDKLAKLRRVRKNKLWCIRWVFRVGFYFIKDHDDNGSI